MAEEVYSMDVIDAINSRSTVRAFKSDPVGKETIQRFWKRQPGRRHGLIPSRGSCSLQAGTLLKDFARPTVSVSSTESRGILISQDRQRGLLQFNSVCAR